MDYKNKYLKYKKKYLELYNGGGIKFCDISHKNMVYVIEDNIEG